MGSLRAQAERDLGTTLESDWGVDVSVVSPDGRSDTFSAQSGDIGALIDPDTGFPVSGRRAHVSLRLTALWDVFDELPKVVADSGQMPWRVGFGGAEFSIRHSMPDETLGVLTCIVEHWTP